MKVYTIKYLRENLFLLLRGPAFKIRRYNRIVATVLTGNEQVEPTPPPEPQVAPPSLPETPPPEIIKKGQPKEEPAFLMGHCEVPGIKCSGIPVVRIKVVTADWETGEKELEIMLCRTHYDKLKHEGTKFEVLS